MVKHWRRNNSKNTSSARNSAPLGMKRAWKNRNDEVATQRTIPSVLKRGWKAPQDVTVAQRVSTPGRKRARRAPESGSFKSSSFGTEKSRSWRYQRGPPGGAAPLNYQLSQKKTHTETPSFSSFFTPSKTERARNVELGLLIKKRWVGLLIGKKGGSIKEIRKNSNGANIDFGDEDVVLDNNKESKSWEDSPWPSFDTEKYTICAISGTKVQATEAARLVAEFIGKSAQSANYKLEFLIPENYCGLFIGKRGANMKDMQGSGEERVTFRLRDCRISLGDSLVSVCTIFGPAKSALKAIERTSNWLADISVKVQMDRDAAKQNQRLPTELPPMEAYSPPAYHPPYQDDSRSMGGGSVPYYRESDRNIGLGRESDRNIGVGGYNINVPVSSRSIRLTNPPNQREELFFF